LRLSSALLRPPGRARLNDDFSSPWVRSERSQTPGRFGQGEQKRGRILPDFFATASDVSKGCWVRRIPDGFKKPFPEIWNPLRQAGTAFRRQSSSQARFSSSRRLALAVRQFCERPRSASDGRDVAFGSRVPTFRFHAFNDQGTLQFSYRTQDGKHHLAGGRARIHLLRERNELDALSLVYERHYSPAEFGELWNLSADTVRRMFEQEQGVLVFENPVRSSSHRFRTLRIPESVAEPVYSRFSNADLKLGSRMRA